MRITAFCRPEEPQLATIGAGPSDAEQALGQLIGGGWVARRQLRSADVEKMLQCGIDRFWLGIEVEQAVGTVAHAGALVEVAQGEQEDLVEIHRAHQGQAAEHIVGLALQGNDVLDFLGPRVR
ncbi:hypothetical protein PFLmoz3_04331 [Pseudomonas fluorescens]|uniref:Uncharacterized protein n=1 Tax=Pseudomonas fluorescens TaxID=294 RepID=A0A109LEQ8_PSEFL|nr:hypothetical protein PFLmoz3_04331 [Pseudomonas fluorescens]